MCKFALLYYLFGIEIGNYISIEEVLNPFLNDALVYIFFVFIPMVIASFFIKRNLGTWNSLEFERKRELPFKTRLKEDIKSGGFLIILFSILIIVAIRNGRPAEVIIGSFLYFPLLQFLYWLKKEIAIREGLILTKENAAVYNISSIIVTFFLFIISQTFLEANSIKRGKRRASDILLSNSLIECNDSLAIIGITRNYTFLYDRKKKRTTVLPNSEVKRIRVDN